MMLDSWERRTDRSYRLLAIILTVYLQLRSEITRDNGWIGSKVCNSHNSDPLLLRFPWEPSRFSSTRDIKYPVYITIGRLNVNFIF